MKRSITMSVGALVLSQFLAFTALATPKCYSTGPLENAVTTQSVEFFVKVLNNDKDDDVQANVVAFGLDGAKILIEEDSFEVEPLSSGFAVLGVGGTVEFEVQVKLDGKAADKSLLGGFGKDENTEWLGSFHHTTHGRDVPGYPHFVQSRAHSLLILQAYGNERPWVMTPFITDLQGL